MTATATSRRRPPADADYVIAYQRGWRYSASPSATLEHLDHTAAPDAAYDGYLDYATGREKWHLAYCRDRDNHRFCDGPPPVTITRYGTGWHAYRDGRPVASLDWSGEHVVVRALPSGLTIGTMFRSDGHWTGEGPGRHIEYTWRAYSPDRVGGRPYGWRPGAELARRATLEDAADAILTYAEGR